MRLTSRERGALVRAVNWLRTEVDLDFILDTGETRQERAALTRALKKLVAGTYTKARGKPAPAVTMASLQLSIAASAAAAPSSAPCEPPGLKKHDEELTFELEYVDQAPRRRIGFRTEEEK